MNVPRHTNRYSNLVSVEVSDVCFQKLTAKPSKRSTRSPTSSSSSCKEESDQGPSLMELYPLSLWLMCSRYVSGLQYNVSWSLCSQVHQLLVNYSHRFWAFPDALAPCCELGFRLCVCVGVCAWGRVCCFVSLTEIVTRFSPDLEWEEAEWNVDTNSYANTVESSSNALNYFPSSLYTRLYQS